MNYQVYLNDKNIAEQNKSKDEIIDFVIDRLKEKDFIINAFELDEVMEAALPAAAKGDDDKWL